MKSIWLPLAASVCLLPVGQVAHSSVACKYTFQPTTFESDLAMIQTSLVHAKAAFVKSQSAFSETVGPFTVKPSDQPLADDLTSIQVALKNAGIYPLDTLDEVLEVTQLDSNHPINRHAHLLEWEMRDENFIFLANLVASLKEANPLASVNGLKYRFVLKEDPNIWIDFIPFNPDLTQYLPVGAEGNSVDLKTLVGILVTSDPTQPLKFVHANQKENRKEKGKEIFADLVDLQKKIAPKSRRKPRKLLNPVRLFRGR